MALSSLGEEQAVLDLAFQKFLAADRHCEYLTSPGLFAEGKWTSLRQQIDAATRACAAVVETPSLAKTTYEQDNYDPALVRLLRTIDERDKRYRNAEPFDAERQSPLDRENLRLIDSLYAVHQTYLGHSLVGKQLEHVMWAVVQHSNPQAMGRYLPVVHAASGAGEVPETVLRLLIDRYYALTEGYQVFGSQGGALGVPLAEEATRRAIERKYGIAAF